MYIISLHFVRHGQDIQPDDSSMCQCAIDSTSVLVSIAVPMGCMANMFSRDNGYTKSPVGFVTFGSRRFNMSLEISIAEILIVIHPVSAIISYQSKGTNALVGLQVTPLTEF